MANKTFSVTESDKKRPGYSEEEARPISNARLAILMLLGAELMLFAGLIGAFLVFRLGSITWPPPAQLDIRLPRAVTGVLTVFLLLSGYTMFEAIRSIRRGSQRELKIWLLATAALGLIFLIGQGSEWIRLVKFGLTFSSGIYGSIFYLLIGCHALHVFGAVVWLLIVFVLAAMKRFSANSHVGVELCTIYWGFVVALWPILYVLVYLV